MSTLVTPSAKSHERVTGRWVGNIEAQSRKERLIYYSKQVIGTPIPWLFAAVICLIFISRAGLEIAAWSGSLLTALYIAFDRPSGAREFQFFRVGGDFFLLGYVLTGLIGALSFDSPQEGLATLGGVRWVLLLYLFTYCWDLFPGLNRLFYLMFATAGLVAGYGIWQHFTGMDLIRSMALDYAPTSGHPYFIVTGLFNTPEIFGTLIACLLPIPAAAFILADRKDLITERGLALGLVVLFVFALFWTYRPGIWIAGGSGLVVTLLLKGRGQLTLLATIAASLVFAISTMYSDPEKMLANVHAAEELRGAQQRVQINTQVQLWQANSWVGIGHRAMDVNNYDPGTGNIYFQILAQFGVFGGTFYLLFVLSFLLSTYRIFSEIPRTHYWHRVLIAGGIGSQVTFHVAGLYWSTLMETHVVTYFIVLLSAISYLSEHYGRGLVPDDQSL